MVVRANTFIINAISRNTRHTYNAAVNNYYKFCQEFELKPEFPISDEYACCFITWLATKEKRLQYSTIKTYSYGIGNLHRELGFGDWPQNLSLFHRCMKGIKRELGEKSNTNLVRYPITTNILSEIYSTLSLHIPTHLVFWAAATMATYGLFRMGEFCLSSKPSSISSSTSSSSSSSLTTTAATTVEPKDYQLLTLHQITLYNASQHQVHLQHFHLYSTVTYYTIGLRSSKTDPFRKGVIIHIGHTIPVQAMLHYLRIHPCIKQFTSKVTTDTPKIPLFIYKDQILTREIMIHNLRLTLDQLGHDSSKYHGHSFRRGGATSLLLKGVSDAMIKTLGRWSSDCYKLYLDIPTEKLLEANRSM